MYYPYLRGKQFELIALREFAEANHDVECIVPIIEPVRTIDEDSSSRGPLHKTVSTLNACGVGCAVVLNPCLGDFERPYSETMILDNLSGTEYIPAFLMNGNAEAVRELIENYSLNDCMLIFTSGVDSEDSDLMTLLASETVKYIVGLDNKSLKRTYRRAGKQVISLFSRFHKLATNSDYRAKVDESYSDDHSFYAEDGFDGFSDYCALPQEFMKSGAQPKSIAIHLTYKKNAEEVWVHHFVSDSEMKGNLQGKFAEACEKVAAFFEGKEKTAAINALLEYYSESKYPGLGMLKKITIANHLELIYKLLSSAE